MDIKEKMKTMWKSNMVKILYVCVHNIRSHRSQTCARKWRQRKDKDIGRVSGTDQDRDLRKELGNGQWLILRLGKKLML